MVRSPLPTLLALACLLGCGGGDDEPEPTPPPPGWSTCTLFARGAARTDQGGALSYHEKLAVARATHRAGDGCITGLELTLSHPGGGCRLEVALDGTTGGWTATSGRLLVDDACGPDLAALQGDYTLDPTASTGGLLAPPSLPAAEEYACATSDALALVGSLRMTEPGGGVLTVWLHGVTLSGDLRSQAAPSDTCPAAIVPCAGLGCGTDPWGVICDSTCAPEGCPPAGPFGTEPGLSLQDAVVFDCDGEPVHLHDICGARAGYLAWFADWCPTCAKFIVQMNAVYEAHAGEGLVAYAILISDAFGNPPTAHDCRAWRDEKQLEMTVVYDPTGATSDYGAKETSVVTDPRGTIVFHATGPSPSAVEAILVEQLAKDP